MFRNSCTTATMRTVYFAPQLYGLNNEGGSFIGHRLLDARPLLTSWSES